MNEMTMNLEKFDDSAVLILSTLAKEFPAPTQIGFSDLFGTEHDDIDKRATHIGVIAFLKHENFIAHETGSASSFIITRDGLALFGEDIVRHLKIKLNGETLVL